MRTVPHTYSEWVELLDIIKKKEDDEAALEAMRQGTIEWQSGVAERFIRKLTEVVNARMNDASDRFQRDMGRAGMQESAIIQALLYLRRELVFLRKAVDLPAIPEKERNACIELVKNQADAMQSSLEESAKRDRSGKLASIVRNHKVNIF